MARARRAPVHRPATGRAARIRYPRTRVSKTVGAGCIASYLKTGRCDMRRANGEGCGLPFAVDIDA